MIDLSSQLARVARGRSILAEHPGREVPGMFGIKVIGDDDLSGPIGPPLLKVVAVGDPVIVMAGAA